MAFRTNKVPAIEERTVSGSSVSFNSALALPLKACKVSFSATQEGSGDPSPDNVRNIVGYNALNIYKRGINQWDEQWEIGYIQSNGNNGNDNNSIRSKNYCACVGGIIYYVKSFVSPTFYICWYDNSKTFIQRSIGNNNTVTAPANARYFRISCYGYGTTYLNNISVNYPSTDTDYHAYTGNIYTIQLGQELYGAEVDVVNGVAHVTWIKQSMNVRWIYSSDNNGYFVINPVSQVPSKARGITNIICDCYKTTESTTITNMPDLAIKGASNSSSIIVRDNSFGGNANDFIDYVKNHYIVYELAEPFDIQLTPTQIETIIGNNTIFADTGDVDLTYKDLDIAKRGNFREVFKLPS